jgi:hypothetical protein
MAASFIFIIFAFDLPRLLVLALPNLIFAVLALLTLMRRRKVAIRSSSSISMPRQRPPMPIQVVRMNLGIAALGFLFMACLLFGFVAFINAYNAVKLVEGQPYHATTFQVIRPYYQKSAGMHGPDISIYASGMVEGQKEWMSLRPYLQKRAVRSQEELNSLVPPGTVFQIYLFPGLRGRNRVQLIGDLPPGEASRRTEMRVLRYLSIALACLGGVILLLVRMRSAYTQPSFEAMAANA